MSIGQVSKQAGVSVETIRFYERAGLLEEPPRSPSGYRLHHP
ncbi:MerR family DNA-binding transcriptional regulator [Thermogutta sp.]